MKKSKENSIIDQVLDLAIKIQQIPAPTFEEKLRAEFILAEFVNEGLSNVHYDEAGNVLGRIPGNPNRYPLVISAHLDTVFPKESHLQLTRLEDRAIGPGIGDNSIGIASLFGLLWILDDYPHRKELPSDIWLIANVGEEGLGNLRGMRKIVNKFKSDVLAYLVIEGLGFGHIYHRALEIQRYRIRVKTSGGHSWVDYGNVSAINELARLITMINELRVPSIPRTSMNVGKISGGTSVNTIASEAYLELDLRSEHAGTLDLLAKNVKICVTSAIKPGVEVEIEQIGHRPGGEIPASHPLVQLVSKSLIMQGVKPVLSTGSTDANIPLNMNLPAVCVGITKGGGAHTYHEYIETGYINQGLKQLVDLVLGALVEL